MVAAGPTVFPVRNGSVQNRAASSGADSSVALASAVGLAPTTADGADPAEGAAWRGANPNTAYVAASTPTAHGGSVYGTGVGMIHRTAEAQITPPANDATVAGPTDSKSAAAPAAPNSTALRTAGHPHEVLLEWSRP